MASLQDIFNLAKADGGKFFVMDEAGEPKLVIMDIEEYQKLLIGKIAQTASDVEQINQEILKAQLQEAPADLPVGSAAVVNGNNRSQSPDLREEVIDPSFDFEGPKVDIEDL